MPHLSDVIPANTTYNNDVTSSQPPAPVFANGELTWQGDVAFDSTVVIEFSVDVDMSFSGSITNVAVIDQLLIAEPVTVTAVSVITDDPIFTLEKTAVPAIPGANKPLTYMLTVANVGQPAADIPITVVDHIPADTTLRSVGVDGSSNGMVVTWTRPITLDFGQTAVFTFSVDVDNVISGTVISNDDYIASSPGTGIAAGDPYTTTVLDPIFDLSKEVWPDPPGSNREMTYTLALFNAGSLATDIEVTDEVPDGVSYVRGGSQQWWNRFLEFDPTRCG